MHLRRPTSPRIQPIEKVAERAREAMKKSPVNAVNVVATLATAREMNKAWGGFVQKLLFEAHIPRRQQEIAILRMGWNCQAVYEFGQHTLFGRDVGLTDDEIYYTTRPIGQGGWAPDDAAVLQMVDDIHADDCVTDATWAELQAHFTDEQIIEFIMSAMAYRTVSTLLNTCGVQLDEGVPGWPEKP
ncbi:MAG: carboxymuconolactone decarboxylase family protein [Acidimicrobiales bacterium]